MKPIRLATLFTYISLSYWLMAARTNDVMSELRIDRLKLQQDVLINLKEPKWFYFNPSGVMRQVARQVPESSRAATVRALGNVIRAYVESSTFKELWLQSEQETKLQRDFAPLLKQRLEDFITLAETVDFATRLVPMGHKQEFANPFYQRKPAEWKFLYRLGQGPVTEARLFAQQWLTDLQASSNESNKLVRSY